MNDRTNQSWRGAGIITQMMTFVFCIYFRESQICSGDSGGAPAAPATNTPGGGSCTVLTPRCGCRLHVTLILSQWERCSGMNIIRLLLTLLCKSDHLRYANSYCSQLRALERQGDERHSTYQVVLATVTAKLS